jgi:hypothetical protein
VLDQFLLAMIEEAGGKPLRQSDNLVRLPQQQGSSVRRNRSAIETTHNFAAAKGSKSKLGSVTLCQHRGGSESG